MAQIAAYDDVKATRTQRDIPNGHAWRTEFLCPPKTVSGEPHAFLAEGTPHRVIGTHFHIVDQYQVIVSGGGVLGKHPLVTHAVHFSRAYTPYGPLVADDKGLGFLTLRSTRDPGAQHLPKAKETLLGVPDRKPWQVTEAPNFSGNGDVILNPFAAIKDDAGLAAYSVKLKPGARASAPDPATTAGQYLIITSGSIVYEGKDHKAITIVFVKPNEKSFDLLAGPQGMEALVLNFPRTSESANVMGKTARSSPGARVWQCQLCSFSYDETKGMPEEGVAPGTRWEDVPESWSCPDCAAAKSDFVMEVVA